MEFSYEFFFKPRMFYTHLRVSLFIGMGQCWSNLKSFIPTTELDQPTKQLQC